MCPRGYQTAWADDKPVYPPYAISREQIYPEAEVDKRTNVLYDAYVELMGSA